MKSRRRDNVRGVAWRVSYTAKPGHPRGSPGECPNGIRKWRKQLTGRTTIAAFQRKYLSLLRHFRISDQTFLIILAVVVAVVVGGGSFLYTKMLEFSSIFFWEILPGWIGHHKAFIIFTPFAGALLPRPFIKLFPKDANDRRDYRIYEEFAKTMMQRACRE
jgi:hypothetical protein